MRIGASRQKYSPWLVVHFNKTEIISPDSGYGETTSSVPTLSDTYAEEVIFLAHFDEDISVSMAMGIYSKPYSDASLHKRLFGIQWTNNTSTATVTVGSVGVFPNELFSTGYFLGTGHADSYEVGGMIVIVPAQLGPYANVEAKFEANTEFTMEGYVYGYPGDSFRTAFGFYERTTTSGRYVEVGMDSLGHAIVRVANESQAGEYDILSTSYSLAGSAWKHLAVIREISATISLFINGIKQPATVSWGGLVIGDLGRLAIGGNRTAILRRKIWQGGVDEVRFTKNIARYKSNFAPLTTRFPNP